MGTTLRSIHLDGNEISGTIPSTLGNLHNLKIFSASHNLLHGTVPSQVLELQELEILYIPHNGLTGTIPRNGIQDIVADCGSTSLKEKAKIKCYTCSTCCNKHHQCIYRNMTSYYTDEYDLSFTAIYILITCCVCFLLGICMCILCGKQSTKKIHPEPEHLTRTH